MKATLKSEAIALTLENNYNIAVAGNTVEIAENNADLLNSNLESIDVEASIAGSGDISVYCKGGTLKATVAGSGDIVYSGKPDKVDSKVVGSGSVSN